MIRNICFRTILCIGIVIICGWGCSTDRDIKYFKARLQTIEVDSLPEIKILSEIRVFNGDVYLTYEVKGEFGQRHVKCFSYNTPNKKMNFIRELFKKDNGYSQLFVPVLFEGDKNSLFVTERDNPVVNTVSTDGLAVRTDDYIISTTAQVPYPILLEARQAFYKASGEYLFIGREPQGGSQALFYSRNLEDTTKITEISKISFRNEATSWMINFGKMVYDQHRQVAAYAYQLYPVMQFFDLKNSRILKSVQNQLQNPEITMEGADVWEQNNVQYKDITSNNHHIYTLFWGKTFDTAHQEREKGVGTSEIIQYDWNGRIQAIYKVGICLEAIGVSGNDDYIICYDGEKVYHLDI